MLLWGAAQSEERGPSRRVLTVSLLSICADDVRVVVTDGGSPTVPMIHPLDPTRPGGRGLFLVDSLSDRWGLTREGTRETQVWFEIGRRHTSRFERI